jgi:predicted ATPase
MLSDQFEYRGNRMSSDERLALRMVFDKERPADLDDFVRTVQSFRVYRSYNLYGLRRNGSRQGAEYFLNPSGENAFTVLRNWRDRREHRPRYDFVLRGLRGAFPELCADIDFDIAGLTVSAVMVTPRGHAPIPAYFTPNGWLTAMLHLCAVAGGEPGSVVALDEIENTLHPFAIRTLVELFREWSDEHGLTVCLATHSPVLLDAFRDEPEKVFVMDLAQTKRPRSLTELENPEFLAQFSLGDLFAHGEFGGQTASATTNP